ncbi:MAG: TonB-dependent receptor [Bryobacteraceae bacterium]|nr:TonB-dependent receptor [Bryobacteraceae bacterium]
MATLICTFSPAAFAQGGATSRISGQVFDSSQAAIPGAKVTLENQSTGLRRESQTDNQGRYVFPDLNIGTYKLTAEAQGFATQTRSNVQLAVAQFLTADFTLSAGQISEVVEVTGTAAPVEANAANGSYFSNKQLVDLPINGRDYGRFTLLTPGAVARSNFIADMGFNGMHTIANNFSIDGVDGSRIDQPYMANGFERGARLLTGSLDTIAEVRVQTSNYNAEYGRSAGSSVAIVSKSGSNEFHGSVFEFFRNDALDARNFFNIDSQPKASLRYNNFGGNLGGPIVRNKTFFFANYEGSRQRVGITGTGTVPSLAARELVVRTSPALRSVVEQYPLGTSRTANPLVDNYTTFGVSRVREDTGSIKIDHTFSDRGRIYGRYNKNSSEVFGPLFGVTPAALGINDFQQVPVNTQNGTLVYSRSITPRFFMELQGGLQRWASQINSELPIPQVNTSGFFSVVPGSRRFTQTNSTMQQYGGSASWVREAHTFKFGGTVWMSQVNPLSRDLITVTYANFDDFVNNRVNQATVLAGDPGSRRAQNWYGFYAQDTWRLRQNLTLDYGIRLDGGPANFDPQGIVRPFDLRTNTLGAPGAQWYESNLANWGPRIALAWQPVKKMVVRTGYGIFYQQYPPGFHYGIRANTLPGNTTLLRSNIANLSYPVEPFVSAGTQALPNVGGFNWDKPELYAQQWNFTIQYELPGASSLQAAYVGNHGLNLRRARNINFFDPALGRRPIAGVADVAAEFNDAQSVYHGLQLNFTKRMGAVYGVFNYTFAKVIDNVQDYGLYSTQPQDNRCLGPCERGLGSGDIRHNITYTVLYDLPFGRGKAFAGGAEGLWGALISGWQVSSLGLIRSGIAEIIQIPISRTGDNNTANQRPDRVAGVDIFPANQTINNWYNPAAFATPAQGRFGNAGRTVGRSPDFWQFDASLTKNTSLTERFNLQFRTEVFNLFNRPNFGSANQFFGTPNFGRIFNTFGRTVGFGTSRQIQMSLRLRF